MARLDKMLLQGVRSFGLDAEDQQMIKFMTPMTLILGQNGCGKTTIIEALKVATCGEYPPGSASGKLFVHDPKVSHVTESKGQVRLKIFDAKGESLEITRSFQTTNKQKTSTFKTIDQTIKRIDKSGVASTVSYRCVDIDAEMCSRLGVSKAILNYVIFCHQEDSNWPLEEGKKLKERFDAIFDSTKYNKCLDQIAKLRKEKVTKIALLGKDVDNLRERKDELVAKRASKVDLERQVNVSKDQVLVLKSRLDPINKRLEEIADREMNIMKIHTEQVKKRTQLQGLQEQQNELRKNIAYEFKGSTHDLQDAIAKFKAQLKDKQNSMNFLDDRLQTLVRSEDRLLKSISVEQVKLGQLQNEEAQKKQWVDSRNLHLNRIAQDLGIPATQYTQLSEVQVTNLLSQVDGKVKEQEEDLDTLRAKLEAEERELQEKIDKCRDDKTKLEHDIESKRGELSANKAEYRKKKAELDEVDLSAGKLARLEGRLARAKRDLDDVTASVDVNALKTAIADSLDKRNRYDERLEVVNKEVQVLQQQSVENAELEVKREARTGKEAEVRRLRNKHEEALGHLLGAVPDHGWKYELEACQEKLAQDIKDLNARLNLKQQEVATLETNRKHQKDQLRVKEEDLVVNEEQIYNCCENKPFDDVVAALNDTIAKLQDESGTLTSSTTIFRRYVSKLQQPNTCCPVCHRDFNSDADVKDLINELTAKMRQFPTRLQESKRKLEELSTKYDRLQQMKPTHLKIAQLKDAELPKLRSELSATEAKLASVRQEVNELQMCLVEPQENEKTARSIQADIFLLDQNQAEIRNLAREIERIEARLPAGASSRSMQQALSEQEQLRSDLAAARRLYELSQDKLTKHTEQLQQLREQRNALVEEQLRIQGGVANRKPLEDRLTELQVAELGIIDETDRLQAEVGPAKSRLDAAARERERARHENRASVEKMRNKLSTQEKRIDEVRSWQKAVEDYERRDMGAKLVAAQGALSKLEREKDSVKLDREEVGNKIDGIRKDLSTQQVRERELEDNLKLRHKMEEEKALATLVRDLDERLGDLDYPSIQREKMQLRKDEEAINKDKHVALGRQNALEESIVAVNRELRKDVYKNAEANFTKAFVDKTVETEAVGDLKRFCDAMEWAMIHFHEERMKTINGIIRELWRQIYRGNDIDCIEIKTDHPESKNDKRRVYNYRVVQYKGDAELDMRGRCSSGQKVLACLIIRMALAETFSASCGIFALDEPTTNLDRENIESLSNALADIVNARMAQKNFQLIVITHDEEFLDSLTKVERVRHYFKVSRNNVGKSKIEKFHVGV